MFGLDPRMLPTVQESCKNSCERKKKRKRKAGETREDLHPSEDECVSMVSHSDSIKSLIPSSLLCRNHAIDGLSLLQLLFHLNHQLHTIDHQLDLLHFRGTQAVSVGDVEDAAHGSSVHAAWWESPVQRQVSEKQE